MQPMSIGMTILSGPQCEFNIMKMCELYYLTLCITIAGRVQAPEKGGGGGAQPSADTFKNAMTF
jgi:hypothetical protein